MKELRARLGFLMDVGLDYLSLDRAAGSLSGGEKPEDQALRHRSAQVLLGIVYSR